MKTFTQPSTRYYVIDYFISYREWSYVLSTNPHSFWCYVGFFSSTTRMNEMFFVWGHFFRISTQTWWNEWHLLGWILDFGLLHIFSMYELQILVCSCFAQLATTCISSSTFNLFLVLNCCKICASLEEGLANDKRGLLEYQVPYQYY